jgi:hypothetical protein
VQGYTQVSNQQVTVGGDDKSITSLATPAQIYGWEILINK